MSDLDKIQYILDNKNPDRIDAMRLKSALEAGAVSEAVKTIIEKFPDVEAAIESKASEPAVMEEGLTSHEEEILNSLMEEAEEAEDDEPTTFQSLPEPIRRGVEQSTLNLLSRLDLSNLSDDMASQIGQLIHDGDVTFTVSISIPENDQLNRLLQACIVNL